MKKAFFISILVIGGVGALFFARRSSEPVMERSRETRGTDIPACLAEASGQRRVCPSSQPSQPEGRVLASVLPEQSRERVLSDEAKSILSDETPHLTRIALIKGLGRNLPEGDVAAYRDFLNSPLAEHPGIRPIVLNAVKNDLLDALMNQTKLPEGLGQQIMDMFNAPSSDYMWREYCLQFMGSFYERVTAESKAATPMPFAPSSLPAEESNRQSAIGVRQCLFSALDQRDKDLAGTALLTLTRLSERNKEIQCEELLVKAVEITGDPKASARCRLTAIRIAAADGRAEILPAARELAVNGQTGMLRGAAVTTLGDFGDPQDRSLLEKLSVSGNRQIMAAAKAALAKMEGRK